MGKFIRAGAVLSLVGLSASAGAQAPSACLTDAEARALFTYSIPAALEGVSKSCQAALPPTAFLRTRSAETISHFQAAATGSWPAARAAFMKIAGSDKDSKMLEGMPDKALEPFVAAAFSSVVANDVKPANCPKIDRFVAALAPLPPASVAELITALVGLAGGKETDDFKLC